MFTWCFVRVNSFIMKLLVNSQLKFLKIKVANYFVHKVKNRYKSLILSFMGDFKELYLLLFMFLHCAICDYSANKFRYHNSFYNRFDFVWTGWHHLFCLWNMITGYQNKHHADIGHSTSYCFHHNSRLCFSENTAVCHFQDFPHSIFLCNTNFPLRTSFMIDNHVE